MTHAADDPPALPDKLYFRVGEVSRIADVPAYVLRFWETEFTQIRPKRTASGQRLYRKRDVETILAIKKLLYEKKFTIQGARQHLRSPDPTAGNEETGGITLDEIRNELIAVRKLLD